MIHATFPFTMQVFIHALRARPTAGPVNQVLWEAKQVWQNMLFLYVLVYHRAYITFCILMPGTGTSLHRASTTRTIVVAGRVYLVVYNSIYLTCTERFTCCFFATTTTSSVTTAVTGVVVVVVVVLTLTHRYYKAAVRGHRTGSNNLYSSVQYARNIMRLFLYETHARGAQIRDVART